MNTECKFFIGVLGVSFTVILICLTIYVYHSFYVYRRHKHGNVTFGQILKKQIKQNPNCTPSGYEMTFSYKDTNSIDSNKEIEKLVKGYIKNNSQHHIPDDIINLFTKYVNNSFKFYYGPFIINDCTDQTLYNLYKTGDPIRIHYDPLYKQNAKIYDDNNKNQSLLCPDVSKNCHVFCCILGIFLFLMVVWFILEMSFMLNHINFITVITFTSIWIILFLMVMIIIILLHCSLHRKLNTKLHFINYMHDDDVDDIQDVFDGNSYSTTQIITE